MIKRGFQICCLALLLLVPAMPAYAAIPVYVGDHLMEWTVEPQYSDNYMMVPVADVCDVLGATYEWNGAEQTVVLERTFDGVGIWMQVGNQQAFIHDLAVNLDAPPIIYGGHVLVPLRFSAEAMGETVRWDPTLNVGYITNLHTTPHGDEAEVWAGTWQIPEEGTEVYIRRDGSILYGNFYDIETGGELWYATFEGNGDATSAVLEFTGTDGNYATEGTLTLSMMQEGQYFLGIYEDANNPSSKRDWNGVKQ